MPECPNADAGLRQLTIGRNADAGLTFLRHSGIHFPYLWFGRALGFPFTTTSNSFFKCRNVGLFDIQSVRYRNEQKF
jgi:hypothetical protein